MKKQKTTKLKRLILRIASVISLISVLLCSVCFSVSADTFENVTFDYASKSFVPYQFYYGRDYYIDDTGSGHNGTVIYRGYRLSGNNIYWGDSSSKTLNDRHVAIQLTFSQNLSFVAGQRYKVSFPLRFVGMEPPVGAPSIFGKVTLNKLSLIRFGSTTSYYDVWQKVDYNVLGNGYVYLDYTFTMSRDFVANGIGLGFNYEDTQTVFNVSVTGFDISGSLEFSSYPVYIMPDFTNQNDIDQAERDWINNNGDYLDYLDQYFSGFENLSSNFDRLIPRLSKFTLLFNSVIVRNGSLFNDILAFAVVIGVSALLINVIGQVGSFISRSTNNAFKGGRKK